MTAFVIRSASRTTDHVTVSVLKSGVTSDGFTQWDYRVTDGIGTFDSAFNPGTTIDTPSHWTPSMVVSALIDHFRHYAEVLGNGHTPEYIAEEYGTVSDTVWGLADRNALTWELADVVTYAAA